MEIGMEMKTMYPSGNGNKKPVVTASLKSLPTTALCYKVDNRYKVNHCEEVFEVL